VTTVAAGLVFSSGAPGHGSSHRQFVPHVPHTEAAMATGETGFDDVTYDLISVQYHSLKAGHDYGQYVRDAENAGRTEIAEFFRQVMKEDSERAKRCHEFIKELSSAGEAGPAVT
jgi:hypothetical protein